MSDYGIWITLVALVILYTCITLLQRGKRRRLLNMQNQDAKLHRKVRYNPSDLQTGVRIANWKLAVIASALVLFGVLGRITNFFPAEAAGYWWISSTIGILMFIFCIK
jgi:integral membrane sensor domain MASE1